MFYETQFFEHIFEVLNYPQFKLSLWNMYSGNRTYYWIKISLDIFPKIERLQVT
jgi:hypothetical protein